MSGLRFTRVGAGLGLVLAVVACGSTGAMRRGSSDVITKAEIHATSANTVYDVILQLRPHFLRSRGPVSMRNPQAGYPVVYLNDVRHGGIESLRTIDARAIAEIRYLNAQDATTRWGTGHVGGAILLRADM